MKNSANVIAYKQGMSSKEIIIGAHYDSVSRGKGVDDNGSGVGVMLEVAERLKNVITPYSIKFVAFGAEEVGLQGSNYYVTQMSQQEKDNTVLMVNLDSLVAGDFMYVHGSPGSKGFARELALDIAKKRKFDVTINPGLNPAYPAGTTGDWSDHAPFNAAGIPYMYFEGTNFSIGDLDGSTQTESNGSIWHTNNDTIEYIEKNFPGRIEKHLFTFSALLKEFVMKLNDSNSK
ncbi:MAG: M20/M25/M40 family metallo-hydrolase [Lysinibacillus sp.]